MIVMKNDLFEISFNFIQCLFNAGPALWMVYNSEPTLVNIFSLLVMLVLCWSNQHRDNVLFWVYM